MFVKILGTSFTPTIVAFHVESNPFAYMKEANLFVGCFYVCHCLMDNLSLFPGTRVAPDTELAGYPAVGYPVSGRISG